MWNRISKSPLCLAATATLLFAGCGDDPDDPDDPDRDRPEESQQIVSDAQLETFHEAGVQTHLGMTPPEPDGTYSTNDLTLTHTNTDEEVGTTYGTHDYSFETAEGEFDYEVSIETPSGARADGVGGIIAGADDCFTIFAETAVETEESDCPDNEFVELFIGCIDDDGDIEDFENPYMITDADDSEDCDYEDGDLWVLEDDRLTRQ